MNFKIEKDNTILLIIPTYNRVEGLKRAVTSVLNQDYKKWKIAVIDDGCIIPAKDIVREITNEEDLSKIYFYYTGENAETKLARKNKNKDSYDSVDQHAGALFFPAINKAMSEIDFDIASFLCDDDLLVTGYLTAINIFYKCNPEIIYSYSNCVLFDERYENWWDARTLMHRFTRIGKVHPFMKLDTSQVSWRSKVFKEDGCRLLETPHSNFDAYWFNQIADIYGLCPPNLLISQFKNFDRNIFNL
jgi:glycosyltransferase involved in cell wall biosynthesis